MLRAVPLAKKQTSTYPKSPTRQQGKEFLRHVSYILKKKRNNKHHLSKRYLNTGTVITLYCNLDFGITQ